MLDKKKEEKTIWDRHKKKIIIVGGVVITIVAGVLIYKYKDSIVSLFKSVPCKDLDITNQPPAMPPIKPESNAFQIDPPEAIIIVEPTIINGGEPYDVSGHIRNLPNGKSASPEKIAEAAELGITLEENQTWVSDYVKNAA